MELTVLALIWVGMVTTMDLELLEIGFGSWKELKACCNFKIILKVILNWCLGFKVLMDYLLNNVLRCGNLFWVIPTYGYFSTAMLSVCQCPRPGWMELWATWSSEMCPCPWQVDWNWWSLKVPFNLDHFIYGWVTLFLVCPKSENALTWCTNTFFLLFSFSSQWAIKKLEF